MKNGGITLIELMVTLVISGFVILMMTCQFIAEYNFRCMINDQVAAENEAAIVMDYLTRVFRFAITGDPVNRPIIIEYNWPGYYGYTISFYVEGGHLSDFPDPNAVYLVGFGRLSDGHTFIYNKSVVDGPSILNGFVIADNISDFVPVRDSDKELTLQVAATTTRTGLGPNYSRSSSLESKIHSLGN